jgi:hypothetical protein
MNSNAFIGNYQIGDNINSININSKFDGPLRKDSPDLADNLIPVDSSVLPPLKKIADDPSSLLFKSNIFSNSLFEEDSNNGGGVDFYLVGDSPMLPEDLQVSGTSQFQHTQPSSIICSTVSNTRNFSKVSIGSTDDKYNKLFYFEELVKIGDFDLEGPSPLYLIRGIATSLRKFKVSKESGVFEVAILLDDGFSKECVSISSPLCEEFLEMTVADYLAIMSLLDKMKAKETKQQIMNRFQRFYGIFHIEKRSTDSYGSAKEVSSKRKKHNEDTIQFELIDIVNDRKSVKDICKYMLKNHL